MLRLNVNSGRAETWRELALPDAAGMNNIYSVQIPADDKSYFYTYMRRTSDLYVIEGLR